MMDLEKMPIIAGLEKYWEERTVRFHMPGHKANMNLVEEAEYLRKHLYDLDVTEVEGTDNLHMPQQMIAQAHRFLAEAFGASESIFLVNGSTGGMLGAILGLTSKGDRVLVQRNCHQSIYNALYLGDLKASYLYPEYVEGFGFASGLSLETVSKAIEENPGAKALILTYPTFYGTCCPLEEIARVCHSNGILLIVDEAHGAHFGFHDRLPKTAMACGADVSINSFHKTLPALTQTAVLHIGETLSDRQRQKIRQMLRMLETSSPSYLFLASADAARWVMQSRGNQWLEGLFSMIRSFGEEISRLPGVQLLGEKDLKGERQDLTRLVIHTPREASELAELLRREHHIQVEMTEGNNLVLIGSVMDAPEFYERLLAALRAIFEKEVGTKRRQYSGSRKSGQIERMPIPVSVYLPQEAEQREWEEVDLQKAGQRISAEKVVPYPPGVPVLLPGERIEEEIVAYLREELRKGTQILKDKSTLPDKIAVLMEG